MSIVFLNGAFMPMEDAKISPMDRGFLFGDGIYEVIPSYSGKLVGFGPHIKRMQSGLAALDIELQWDQQQWLQVCEQLIEKNGSGNLGIYLHVSRGADTKRFHAYSDGIQPTVFAYAFEINPPPVADKSKVSGYRVTTAQDLRWQHCDIKSTALLGNVMHFQQSYAAGKNETILYNSANQMTEGSACNAYIVKDGRVITPPLDNHILPGITRFMLLDILRKDGTIEVEERPIDMSEVFSADEVWLSSSSKDIVPVIEIDGKAVGDGQIGDVWLAAQKLYSANKFNY